MAEQRIIAVGDIHGSYHKLKTLLSRLEKEAGADDILLFVGDYIDRGPHSFEVVETISELADKKPRQIITLMGNHERMFLDFIDGQYSPPLFSNGLDATIRNYCLTDNEMSKAHLQFYRHLKLFHETDDHIFVHAGLLPGRTLEQQEPHDLIWIREPFLQSDYDFGKTVVFGHTPFKAPLVAPGRLGLDTGAVYGGPLTAVILPEMKFITAE